MPDRSIAPPYVKSVSFDLIKPDLHEIPDGPRVFFINGGSQDVLKIEFIFEAGRWFEKKTTAAYFTSQLLSKGTKGKSSFEIASIFDQYGAHLEISPGLDFVSISLYAVHKNLEVVLKLLIEILTTPVFPEKEFQQTKAVFLQNLEVNNEKTSYVASQVFRKNLFGNQHPYGVHIEKKHVDQLNVRDFHEHFNELFHSPEIFVSGKVVPAHRDIMLSYFSQFGKGSRSTVPAHQVKEGPVRDQLKKKESVQSSVRMGKRSVLRSHEDYVGILFTSHILGGYFGSRLMKNIREEKGLTYGISSSLHGMKHDSYLIIGADVNKENTDLTFDEIRKELKTLRTTLVSSDELETTRNHFIGGLQSEMTTPFAHAEKIKTIVLYGLKQTHYADMIKKIDTMTSSEIAGISERYFHEDNFYQVAVG